MKKIYFLLISVFITLSINAQEWVLQSDVYGTYKEDALGWSIKSSYNGNTFITGILDYTTEDVYKAGGAEIYNVDNGVITKVGNTIISGDADYDKFGCDVAINDNGSIVAVSSILADSGSIQNTGAVKVYMFDSNNNIWKQLGNTIYGDAENDSCGWSISLDAAGKYLAVSSIMNDNNNLINNGKVIIYTLNSTTNTWEQVGNTLVGIKSEDNFGSDVCFNYDGTILAVGVRRYDNGNSDAGAAETFNLIVDEDNNIEWKQFGSILHGDEKSEHFGWALDLSNDGKILIVGSTEYDGSGYNRGKATIYSFNETTNDWELYGSPVIGEVDKDEFGISVSILSDGSKIAIGSRYNNEETGYVKIYEYGTNWVQIASKITGQKAYDWFGNSVDFINNDKILIGSPKFDHNSYDEGSAQIYALSTGTFIGDKTYNKSNVKVYPTIVLNNVNILTTENIKNVQVYDITGKNIKSFNKLDNNIINLSDVQPGIYVIRIQTTDSVITQKIIKK